MSGPAERPGDLDAAIGERVRHVRKAAGVTQEQLAGALGVTPTAVSYWENGKRSITPSIMVRVARALSVEVAALLPESWVRSAWFLVPPSPSPVESGGELEWRCSKCGGSPESHAPASSECVYDPILTPSTVSVPLPEWEALPSVYIASKARHWQAWQRKRDEHPHIRFVCTWIDEGDEGATIDWSDLWTRCVTEAASADAVIAYYEQGDELKGALVEVGVALGAGKPVYLVGHPPHSWVNHPNVRQALSVDDALALVAAADRGASR